LILRGLFLLLLLAACAPEANEPPALSHAEKTSIARLIFHNECAGHTDCLTSWNKGEEFASLGIGHFIWYPENTLEKDKRFSESFPALMRFMQKQGIVIPAWLHADAGCPWPDRLSFQRAQQSLKMRQLRTFLGQTMSEQADFMARRLTHALPRMLESVSRQQRQHIHTQYERVATAPMGMYALMDYVNFKGEGVNPKERYREQGWGLLQVLNGMHGKADGEEAIRQFAASAEKLLTLRVALAPAERHEQRWLPGWKKRLQTYIREASRISENRP